MGDNSPDERKLLGAIFALSDNDIHESSNSSGALFDDENVMQYWQATQRKLQIEEDSDNAVALYAIQSLYGHRSTIDPVTNESRYISGFPLPRNWSVLIPPTVSKSKISLSFSEKGEDQQYCMWDPDAKDGENAVGYLKDEFIDNDGISSTKVVLDRKQDVATVNIMINTTSRYNSHRRGAMTSDQLIEALGSIRLGKKIRTKHSKTKISRDAKGKGRTISISQGDTSYSVDLSNEWTMVSFLTFTKTNGDISKADAKLEIDHILRTTTYKFIPSNSLVPDIDVTYTDKSISKSILITPYMHAAVDDVEQDIPALILTDADTQASYINDKLIFPPPDNVMDMTARTAIMKVITGALVDVVDKEIEHLQNESQYTLNGVLNAHSQTLYQLLSTTPRMVPSSVAWEMTNVEIQYYDNCLLHVEQDTSNQVSKQWDRISQRVSSNENFGSNFLKNAEDNFSIELKRPSYAIDGNSVSITFIHKTESRVDIPVFVRPVSVPTIGSAFEAIIAPNTFNLSQLENDEFQVEVEIKRLEWPGTSAEPSIIQISLDITTLSKDSETNEITTRTVADKIELEVEPTINSEGVITFKGMSLSRPKSEYSVTGTLFPYTTDLYNSAALPSPIGYVSSDINNFILDHVLNNHKPDSTRIVESGTQEGNAPYNPKFMKFSYISKLLVSGSVRALKNPSTFSPPFLNTNDEYLLGIILNMSYEIDKLHDELDDLDDRLTAIEKSLKGTKLQMIGEIFLGFSSLLPFGAPMGILILAGAGILFVDAARSGDVFTAVTNVINIFIGAITIHHTTTKQRMKVLDSMSAAYESIMNSVRSVKNDFKRSSLKSLVNRNAGARNKNKSYNAFYSGLLVNEHSHIAVLQSGLTMLPDSIGPHLSSKSGPVGALSRYLDKKNLGLSHSELLIQQSKNVEGDILGVMGTMGVGSNVGINNVNPKRGSNPQMGGLGSTILFYKIDDYDSVTGVAKRSIYRLPHDASPDDLRYEAAYHYKMVYPDATKAEINEWMSSEDYRSSNSKIFSKSQEIHESKLRSLKGYTLNNYSTDRELSPAVMLELFNMYNENQSSENFRYNLTRNNCHMMAKVPASIIMGYAPEELPMSAYNLPYAESLSRVMTRELSSLDNALDPFRVHSYKEWDKMVSGYYRTNSAYHSGEWGVRLYTSDSIENAPTHDPIIFGTYLDCNR